MPLVRIDIMEGRPPEKIRELHSRVAALVAEILDTPIERVRTYITQFPPEGWGIGGVIGHQFGGSTAGRDHGVWLMPTPEFQRAMQEAYAYIVNQIGYMNRARDSKMARGLYGGGCIPLPYVLDRDISTTHLMDELSTLPHPAPVS